MKKRRIKNNPMKEEEIKPEKELKNNYTFHRIRRKMKNTTIPKSSKTKKLQKKKKIKKVNL